MDFSLSVCSNVVQPLQCRKVFSGHPKYNFGNLEAYFIACETFYGPVEISTARRSHDPVLFQGRLLMTKFVYEAFRLRQYQSLDDSSPSQTLKRSAAAFCENKNRENGTNQTVLCNSLNAGTFVTKNILQIDFK